jgi:ABC-type bacteriocin/lantibiotic exporter with double-glycine peptidase domain
MNFQKFKMLQKLRHDRKGFINSILSVGIGIMVLVAICVAVAYFMGAIPTITDPVANQTITDTFATGWNALSILGIAILISAVVTIIVVLMQSFGFMGTGGRGQ